MNKTLLAAGVITLLLVAGAVFAASFVENGADSTTKDITLSGAGCIQSAGTCNTARCNGACGSSCGAAQCSCGG